MHWVRETYGTPPHKRASQQARYMQTQFAFPEPITIRLTDCRAPNAYWDEEYREVTLCFELIVSD